MLLDWRREVDSSFLSAICLCLPLLRGNFRVDTRRLFNSTQPLFSLSSSVQTRPSEEHWFYYEQSKRSKAPNIAAVPLFVCVFFFVFFFTSPARVGKLCLEGPDGLKRLLTCFFEAFLQRCGTIFPRFAIFACKHNSALPTKYVWQTANDSSKMCYLTVD